MKKLILSVVASFAFLILSAQDENIKSPDFVNTIYVVNGNDLMSLEKQEASIKVKIKAATFIPYANLAGGTKSSAIISGAKSNVRFGTTNLKFIYEPSVMVDPEQNVKIIPLESNEEKDQRSVQTGTSSIFRAKANELPKVPFTYKKYKDKYIIIEVKDLPKGEYGILIGSMNQTNAELKYQLFGID